MTYYDDNDRELDIIVTFWGEQVKDIWIYDGNELVNKDYDKKEMEKMVKACRRYMEKDYA